MSLLVHWLKERAHDAGHIPLNLGRDGGERYGRVCQTLHQLRQRRLHIPAGLYSHSSRPSSVPRWVFGIHLLLVQLFDLCGGPELLQFLMRFLTHTTALTEDEKETAVAIFGPQAMRYSDIRIAQGGILKLIFRLNGNLAFTTWYTINLPQQAGKQRHTRRNSALLVHEITHVYQYHTLGTRYMTEAIYILVKSKRNCYSYGGVAGLAEALRQQKSFGDFNREQQAQIVQDYFSRQRMGQDVALYQPFLAALCQKEL